MKTLKGSWPNYLRAHYIAGAASVIVMKYMLMGRCLYVLVVKFVLFYDLPFISCSHPPIPNTFAFNAPVPLYEEPISSPGLLAQCWATAPLFGRLLLPLSRPPSPPRVEHSTLTE